MTLILAGQTYDDKIITVADTVARHKYVFPISIRKVKKTGHGIVLGFYGNYMKIPYTYTENCRSASDVQSYIWRVNINEHEYNQLLCGFVLDEAGIFVRKHGICWASRCSAIGPDDIDVKEQVEKMRSSYESGMNERQLTSLLVDTLETVKKISIEIGDYPLRGRQVCSLSKNGFKELKFKWF